MTTGDRKTKTISQAKVFERPWNPGCKAGKKGPEIFIINYTKSLFCIIEWRQKRPLPGKQPILALGPLLGPLSLFDCKLCCFFAAIQSLLFFTVFLFCFHFVFLAGSKSPFQTGLRFLIASVPIWSGIFFLLLQNNSPYAAHLILAS